MYPVICIMSRAVIPPIFVISLHTTTSIKAVLGLEIPSKIYKHNRSLFFQPFCYIQRRKEFCYASNSMEKQHGVTEVAEDQHKNDADATINPLVT